MRQVNIWEKNICIIEKRQCKGPGRGKNVPGMFEKSLMGRDRELWELRWSGSKARGRVGSRMCMTEKPIMMTVFHS